MQDENDLPPADVRRPYYELELERMRWLVRAYLRTRLHKVSAVTRALSDTTPP